MKASYQHFSVMPFVMLCRVALFLNCDYNHSNKGNSSTFSWCCMLCCKRRYLYKWNPKVWPFKWKQLSSTFMWCCTRWFFFLSLWMKIVQHNHSNKGFWTLYFPVVLFIMRSGDSLCYTVILTESVDEILKCNHSNESYWTSLSCLLK